MKSHLKIFESGHGDLIAGDISTDSQISRQHTQAGLPCWLEFLTPFK